MDLLPNLSFTYARRFGLEIELNAFDGRDFKLYPLRRQPPELPEGIQYVAELISKNIMEEVRVCTWHHTHNNDIWIVKPDSSCGMEICTPAVKGWVGLKKICKVVDLLSRDDKIRIDDRCSLHVHVDVMDLQPHEVAAVLAYWIKCEAVFLDSVPSDRKVCRYCQSVGMSDLVMHDSPINPEFLIKTLGETKYTSVNTYHMNKRKRDTIEFRIMESEGCRDPYFVKNWVRLLVHFVEMTSRMSLPKKYNHNDPWSSYLWLDPKDVLTILGFWGGGYTLSPGMEQSRNWFLSRLGKGVMDTKWDGVMSPQARSKSKEEIDEIIAAFGLQKEISSYLRANNEEVLYAERYR